MTEEEFDELRPSAFAIAYRMLGSVSEAEHVVHRRALRSFRPASAIRSGPTRRRTVA
jgi:DNA-directed RNA polymerase specialized sigma24 family protein